MKIFLTLLYSLKIDNIIHSSMYLLYMKVYAEKDMCSVHYYRKCSWLYYVFHPMKDHIPESLKHQIVLISYLSLMKNYIPSKWLLHSEKLQFVFPVTVKNISSICNSYSQQLMVLFPLFSNVWSLVSKLKTFPSSS